jgi:hypothetical protein
MSDAKCYHVELRRTADHTLGGAMVFRCPAKDCGKTFAVQVIEEIPHNSVAGYTQLAVTRIALPPSQ